MICPLVQCTTLVKDTTCTDTFAALSNMGTGITEPASERRGGGEGCVCLQRLSGSSAHKVHTSGLITYVCTFLFCVYKKFFQLSGTIHPGLSEVCEVARDNYLSLLPYVITITNV